MYPRLIMALSSFSFVVILISFVVKHRLIYEWVNLCLGETLLAYL
jgi:hypothetical protein